MRSHNLSFFVFLIIAFQLPAAAKCQSSSGTVATSELPIAVAKQAETEADSVAENPFQPFDDLINEFIKDRSLPGAALAIGFDGRLIYEKGFGLADVESNAPVIAESRFRIASISKPITAVAVLKLVEQKKLALDDSLAKVFSQHALGRELHPEIGPITIRQLLQHTAGFDRKKADFDPMFRLKEIGESLRLKRPANQAEIIRYACSRAPDFPPGEKMAYSNVGYCILGRVIETVSGESYAQFVAKEIASPLGMSSLSLGRTGQKFRQPNEVVYYMKEPRLTVGIAPGTSGKARVPRQYGGWVLENMDSHGGWISTAGDLVRFAAAFDDHDHCPILCRESIEQMFCRPVGNDGEVFYGLGWNVRPVRDDKCNAWHSGSLDGTSTLLVRRWDGLSWAILFNSRDVTDGKEPVAEIDPLLHQAAAKVKIWPALRGGKK